MVQSISILKARRLPVLREHKVARQYLKDCSLSEYNRIVTEAKLTPMDRKMLDEYIIKGTPEFRIAMDMNLSANCVQKHLCSCYKHVFKLIA
jgi:FixJ family two-component response regulator